MAWLSVKLIGMVIVAASLGVKAVADLQHRAAVRARMGDGQAEIADHALVTLEGVVRARGEPLLAPLSGKPCVVYRSRLRVYTRRGHGSTAARTLVHEVSKVGMVAFVLVSERGDVLVDSEHAELPIRPSPVIPRNLDRERAFLGDEVVDPHTLGSDEIAIEPGQRIRVHGIARVDVTQLGDAADAPSADVGYRDARQIVRLVGDERHPLTISEV